MPLGVALPPDSSRLQCKTTLSASRIYPALNYTDGRARVDEGSSVVGRFTGLLSSHPILITSNALYLCSRIVVAATTEIASRFDQRRHIYFGFRRSLPPSRCCWFNVISSPRGRFLREWIERMGRVVNVARGKIRLSWLAAVVIWIITKRVISEIVSIPVISIYSKILFFII